ncbi:MAG: RNA 2',3'-cyclic phosphodiesterase [Propionibacteriaceae bacterium]|jgi:2'-5' RNA ligase|nr:RNA 2',3'-cyclic phosphodiesterase [Propionibacteriaceae bacterium]
MRLFIAIPIAAELLEALEAVQQQLKAQGVRAHYTRLENLHITLAFIGNSERVDEAAAVMRQFPLPKQPVELAGFGHFGKGRSLTLWVGLKEHRELSNLAVNLQTALREAGFDIDVRRFRPHITIARQAQDIRDAWVEIPARSQPISNIILYRSDVTNGRRVYTPLETA